MSQCLTPPSPQFAMSPEANVSPLIPLLRLWLSCVVEDGQQVRGQDETLVVRTSGRYQLSAGKPLGVKRAAYRARHFSSWTTSVHDAAPDRVARRLEDSVSRFYFFHADYIIYPAGLPTR